MAMVEPNTDFSNGIGGQSKMLRVLKLSVVICLPIKPAYLRLVRQTRPSALKKYGLTRTPWIFVGSVFGDFGNSLKSKRISLCCDKMMVSCLSMGHCFHVSIDKFERIYNRKCDFWHHWHIAVQLLKQNEDCLLCDIGSQRRSEYTAGERSTSCIDPLSS